MTLRDLMYSDAESVFGNVGEFAESLTLYHYSATALTINQLLSVAACPPIADGEFDAADRRQLAGLYRYGDLGTTTESIAGIFEEDNLDALQSLAMDDSSGRRVTELAALELPASVSIVCDETPTKCDYIIRNEIRWNCIRVIGRDSAMQTVALRRDDRVTVKGVRNRP